jgi:hypothetical protein
MNQHVFTGIFSNEVGQRFLRILQSALDNSFEELCDTYRPNFRDCLLKVSHWDRSIIGEEAAKLQNEFIDIDSIYKQSYINYVKNMRGSPHLKIMINLPSFETFLKTFFINVSNNKFMQDGKYFERGPIEQRFVCMECVRDSLYAFLGKEYVQITQKVEKYKPSAPSIAEDASLHDSDEDSIIPDDSISNIGYHARKRYKDKENRRNIENENCLDECESVSLSDITLSQATHNNRSRDERSRAEKRDDRSHTSSQLSKRSESEENSEKKANFSSRNSNYEGDKGSSVSQRSHATHRSEQSKYDNGSVVSQESKSSRRSYTDSRSKEPSKRDHVHHRYSNKSKDNRSQVSSITNDSNEEYNKAHSSSDEDLKQESRNKSPCRSYVTSLTENSKLSIEE